MAQRFALGSIVYREYRGTGVVIHRDDSSICGVAFDNFSGGHDCGMGENIPEHLRKYVKTDNCWWCLDKTLTPIDGVTDHELFFTRR